ncbi:MAG: hypothetical protein LPK38_06670 [Actinomycetes bacterium]|nr:hypothetical protein [Actinomycetes bacterium]MDX5400095.1 hypothetical protein [Actinomycetes bacterium]MDX5450724.1 hypothetical protein [Actinomycetes bacterium]
MSYASMRRRAEWARDRYHDHEPRTGVVELQVSEGHWAHVVMTYRPGHPGRRTGHPDTWEPPEEGWAEVESVTLTWDEEPDRVEVLDGAEARAFHERHCDAIDEAADRQLDVYR